MEYGLKAMEKVQLGTSMDSLPRPSLERDGGGGGGSGGDVVRELVGGARKQAASGAHYVWHVAGYWLFRVLSTLNLIAAVLIGVYGQVFAYYYRGALCVAPLIATIFYALALGGMAILRENMLSNGTSRSGMAPAHSHTVLVAYFVILGSMVCSFVQPVLVRWTHGLSQFSMLGALCATALFFYCLLISEVLFAAAINLEHSSRQKRGNNAAPALDSTDSGGRYQAI